MQYFYRSHATPETVLAHAEKFLVGRGFTRQSGGHDTARYSDAVGTIAVSVAIEGGHYTRVTLATGDVGESEVDRLAKRLLAEVHAHDDAGHAVRGAY